MKENQHFTYPLPAEAGLEVGRLSRIFDNKSECYKLFWFQAILETVCEGQTEITFDALINKMVADAWYMVSEYRLNLGPSDQLEALVHYIYDNTELKSTEKRETILRFLETAGKEKKIDREGNDLRKEISRRKQILGRNVPYRLQAPFLDGLKGKAWDIPVKKLAQTINCQERLMYYFLGINGLASAIRITPQWQTYLTANQEILRGWIQFNMVSYLQRRNPNVPGIINKLQPPQERKLEKVKRFWAAVSEVTPVRDIYADEPMQGKGMSIDHFVPWSYVAHDELWNLSPTTKSANSSKGSCLPDWNVYFPKLREVQYQAYTAAQQFDGVHALFESCRKEHVNSDEVLMKLYRPALTEESFYQNLEEILLPVWQSARSLGFREWRYHD